MGSVYVGRYKILEEIGRGGMGVVYRGEDPVLERQVAIKVLPPKKLTQKTIDRFLREAKTAARLDSPYIVKIHDIGQDDDVNFIVMECVEGNTLGDMMEYDVVPSHSEMVERLRLFNQVLQAVGYAHDNGVIHRDLKPDNIMVTKNGQVKVMDFGLAFFEGRHSLTEVGQVMGTAAYVSPEQAEGKMTDQRTDIYSLGVILFEMLTGRWPFNASNPLEMFRKVAVEPAPSPGEFNPDVPAELCDIVLRILAKKPDDRYQHVSEILESFNVVLKSLDSSFVASDPYALNALASSGNKEKHSLGSFANVLGDSFTSQPLEEAKNDPTKPEVDPRHLDPNDPQFSIQEFMQFHAMRSKTAVPTSSTPQPGTPAAPKQPLYPIPGPPLREQIDKTCVDTGAIPKLVSAPSSDKPAVRSSYVPMPVMPSGYGSKDASAEMPAISSDAKKTGSSPQVSSFKPFASPTGSAVASNTWMQNVESDSPKGNANRMESILERMQKETAQQALDAAGNPQKLQFCPSCGAENSTSAKTCSGCGSVLRPSTFIIQREANDYFEAAKLLYERCQYTEAIMELLQAIGKDPVFGLSYLYLGKCYLELGEYAQARVSLDKATNLMDDSSEPFLVLADFFQRTGQPDMVLSSLQAAVDRDELNPALRCRLAFLFYEQGRAEACIEQYQAALEIDPNYFEANRQLGFVLAAINRPSEAIHYLEASLRIDPRDVQAYSLLAKLHLKCSQQGQAQQALRDAITYDSQNPDLHTDLASLYLAQNQDNMAAQELAAALELDPGNSEASLKLASLFYQHGQVVEAVQNLEQAQKYHPCNASIHRNLGEIYMYNGHFDKALYHFEELVRLDPSTAELYNKLGRIYQKKRYDQKAISSYQEAVKLHPVSSEYREDLAMAYYCSGQLEASVQEMARAARLDYTNPSYPKAMGILLVDLGNFEEAARQLKHSLEMMPGDAQAHGMLGKALVGQGLANMAISEFQHAMELDKELYILNLPMARAFAQQGKHDQALICFQRFLTQIGNKANMQTMSEAYIGMGQSYLESGDLIRAAESFTATLRRDPNSPSALHGLAKVYLLKKNYKEALSYAEKALIAEPRNNSIKVTIASIYGEQEKWPTAVNILQQAVREDKNDPNIYEQLGRALRKCGRLQDAVNIFTDAVTNFPEHAGHFWWLKGRVEFRQGSFDEALWSYRQALEMFPQDWRIYLDLSKACTSLKQTDDAYDALSKALELAPEGEKKQLRSLLQRLNRR